MKSNMKNAIVGYTGFVGSNIISQAHFDKLYNTTNIEEAFGSNPDTLVYAGVKAAKYLANSNPNMDFEDIQAAISNVEKINPKRIILISTIDVYIKPQNVNEDSLIEINEAEPYGANRLYLEEWVENYYSDHLVVRLPGLYGNNLKKNFIYDLMNEIPRFLSREKYKELYSQNPKISNYYFKQDNGYYKCRELESVELKRLKEYFISSDFSAVNFTDSRAQYQFYNLAYIWKHILIALNNNLKKINIATEPVMMSELYEFIKGKSIMNHCVDFPPTYDMKTKHSGLYGGQNGYILDKVSVMEDIKKFVQTENQ